MKTCPKCQSIHIKPGIHCSRRCANARKWTEESRKKLSETLKTSEKAKLARKTTNPWPLEKLERERKRQKEKAFKTIIEAPFETLKFNRLRVRLLYEQNNCCLICKNEKWLDKPLSLELDHLNGNNKDNSRENVRLLCPNCHSQTDTWRGRNKFPKENSKVTDEMLLTALQNTDSIRQALLSVGLAGKGGNYKRAKRLLET